MSDDYVVNAVQSMWKKRLPAAVNIVNYIAKQKIVQTLLEHSAIVAPLIVSPDVAAARGSYSSIAFLTVMEPHALSWIERENRPLKDYDTVIMDEPWTWDMDARRVEYLYSNYLYNVLEPDSELNVLAIGRHVQEKAWSIDALIPKYL